MKSLEESDSPRPWYQLSIDETLNGLKSERNGLSQEEAGARLAKFGPNELQKKKKTSPVILFLRQFLSPLIYILFVAAIISIAVHHYIDAWVILGVLLANAVVGFIQETRAEKAMEALLQLAAPKAKVRREGSVSQINTSELVPGDIILLEAGDKVPADIRIIESSNLKINESALTGESLPSEKAPGVLTGTVPVADRRNMAFSGTIVTYGHSTAVVLTTGMTTEIGRIANAIQEIKPEKTPVQKSIAELSRYLIYIVLGVLAVTVVMGIVSGISLVDIFLVAVAAAVSAIPEGLPAVVTVLLALGMRAMARRNAIIRKLAAVETLGSATVICSDKTGTLTLNQMTVRRIYIDGRWINVTGEGYGLEGTFNQESGEAIEPDETLAMHLKIGALCNDADLSCEDSECSVVGDPTEGALIVAAAKAGLAKGRLSQDYPRIDEIPFQSEKRYMATLHKTEKGRTVFVKGSLERLLDYSKFKLSNGDIVPLTQDDIEKYTAANVAMAKKALRVIATAYYELPDEVEKLSEEAITGKLVLTGLSGMEDPPREEAKRALEMCRSAGIRVIMITGDHKETAESIAGQLGLANGKAVTGTEMEKLSETELTAAINDISVFARIEPLHKLRIVNALKKRGEVVAMTGDGVNDAPALKSADIGIAMGITGTDIAREASDVVLTDDNFASVVAAVEEGRSIFDRLRNVIFFLIATNLDELLALLLAVSILKETPLVAVQIIWINLVTDTTIAIPLGLEPKAGDELNHPPRNPKVGLIFPGLIIRSAFMATLAGTTVFLFFNFARSRVSLEEARTFAFCSMVTFQWFQSLNARSDEYSVFRLGFFRNRYLIAGLLVSVLLQLMVIYIPPFRVAFHTAALSITEWGIIIGAASGLLFLEELRKLVAPRLFSLGKWKPGKTGDR